ncbi:MAG: GspE/PulE family protein [Planctomycetota bacterium]
MSATQTNFVELIPHEFARSHLVVSNGTDDGIERLIASNSTLPWVLHNVSVKLGRPVVCERRSDEDVARFVDRVYEAVLRSNGAEEQVQGGEGSVNALLAEAERDLLTTDGKAPIVKLVDAILFEALGSGASDIHVQPLKDVALVRIRVDGVLHLVRELSSHVVASVVSRIKVMGQMDIAERRIPQDGRATVTIGDATGSGRAIDLRISSLPTAHGERIVIRLLDTDKGLALADLESIGMPADAQGVYRERVSRPNGIVLLTGPTGSGKTTTLYATLRWIATRGGGDLNVMTIEDPIEYELSEAGVAISQAQVNTKKGVTFASGLRHVLRQDPDVVMVGEIRDDETARVAIQASLTGHLVFSTLHTNDAASAVVRLIDLGVEPYLVASALSCVVAQRLVRKVHRDCAGRGCEACFWSGLRGRMGIFEMLAIDESMRGLISDNAPTATLRERARRAGGASLLESGRALIARGDTTEAEVARVTVDLGDA